MIEIISGFLIVFGLILLVYATFETSKTKPVKKEIGTNYAVLIPARNESMVIEDLLISITKQTLKIKNENVYIIVEDKDDPTVLIASKYKMNIILRKDLSKKRKGYALADAVEEIVNDNKKYDAYFIFDADNVVDKNYFKNMKKSIDEGYDIGIGYRDCKNGNDSIMAACSALTFSMVNSRTRHTITGTGFYISGYLIDKWQTYPFHSLTEDYELTLYAILNDLTLTYNKTARFYDEQPTSYKKTVSQRIRWVKGYLEARQIYIPSIKKDLAYNYNYKMAEVIGIIPLICVSAGLFLYLSSQVLGLILGVEFSLLKLITTLFFLFISLVILTIFVLSKEGKDLNIHKKMKIKSLFIYPLFILSYVPCALTAALKKEVTWDVIEHNARFKSE